MAKIQDTIAAQRATINLMAGLIVGLIAVVIYALHGLMNVPRDLRIMIPPDLREGAIVRPGEYDAATVHAFASATFRELMRWEENGAVDYGKKILELQNRLSAEYREFLVTDMNIKNGEGSLQDRTRYALEMPGTSLYTAENRDLVQSLGEGTWVATISVTIVERAFAYEVRRTDIEYPLVVRRTNISPEKNLWGLVLDGYPDGVSPKVLDVEETKVQILQ